MRPYRHSGHRTISVLTGLFLLGLGTIGNFLVALTLSLALWRGWRSPRPSCGPQSMVPPASGTGVLLLVVCLVDLLYLYLDLLHSLMFLTDREDLFAASDITCGALNVVRSSLGMTSSWLLVALWVQHLVLRRWPSLGGSICSRRAAGILVCLVVALSLAFAAPMGQFFRLVDLSEYYFVVDYPSNYFPKRYRCQFVIEVSENRRFVLFVLDIALYSLLPGVLVIVNVLVALAGRCKARQKVLAGLDRSSAVGQARFQADEESGDAEDQDAPAARLVWTSEADCDRSPLVSLGYGGEGRSQGQGQSSRGQVETATESALPGRREGDNSDRLAPRQGPPPLEHRRRLDGEEDASTATVHTDLDPTRDVTAAGGKDSFEQKGLTGTLLVLSLLYVIFIFGYDGVDVILQPFAPVIEPSVYYATKLFVYLAQWTPFRDQFLTLCRVCCCCCRPHRRSTNAETM